MACSPQDLLAKADAAIEWYWQFGTQRTGQYEILRAWPDEMYRARERARAMLRAAASPKPCLALWGPSQSGKSTLLSRYLDEKEDEYGQQSPLRWSEEEPVRFVVGRRKEADVIVLNPFNFASDASGCVSRYTFADSVPDPAHPVGIEFASESQLMHALAAGYLSECEASNARQETTQWNAESFKALLEKQKPSGPPQRAAFEALQQLGQTIDLLILSRLPRYADLAAEGQWEKSLRSTMLRSAGLLSSPEAVENFAFELLWDNWPSLTETFRKLAARRRRLTQEWGAAPVRCSYRAAAVLLDIDSYKKAAAETASPMKEKVLALSVSQTGGAVCLGQGGGSPLVRNAEEFGHFQALVWELRIPVRRTVLRERPVAEPLCEFLERADLLDFPGVGNSSGNAKLHRNEDLLASPRTLLTEVLKRGKTASIVVTSARNLDIDGFSILVRVDRFPGQPVQLASGIESWMRSFRQPWPPHGRVLPLNLIITFCGVLVNQVRSAGTRDGLQPVFDRLRSLSYLADPKIVSTFSTNYPQFDEGVIHGEPKEQDEAVEAIIQDKAFQERFGDGAESFREMHRNGGTDFVFRQLARQAAASGRAALVAAQLEELCAHTQRLIEAETPGDTGAADERNRALLAWAEALREQLKRPPASELDLDSATRLSRHLRSFVNVDPEELDDVPLKAIDRKVSLRTFIEKQFRIWQAKRANFPALEAIGLHDGAQATRILGYLIEASDTSSVEAFFREWLGHLERRLEAKHARRFLAVQMSNAVLSRPRAAPHRPTAAGKNSVRVVLEKLAQAEDRHSAAPELSPHYATVIEPFLKRLENITKKPVGERAAQIGDAELAAIAQLP